MKLELLFLPTTDLAASLATYRSLGFEEVWREGDSTAAMAFPGSELQIMLDSDDPTAKAGPMFVVESVADFHAARPAELEVFQAPSEIPDGFIATYRDAGGTTVYVLDQSSAQ